MAKKEETTKGVPVKMAKLYEVIDIAGFPNTKTLAESPSTRGLKMYRTEDATLLVEWANQTHEIRNFKALTYA